MNTPANALHESHVEVQVSVPAAISESRRLYWCVRREIWENRSIYIAPIAVAALFLLGFLINAVRWIVEMRGAGSVPDRQDLLVTPYNFSALLLMGAGFLVALFYCLETLHAERRDRSILFWKSLPVSDLTTVLSKASIPIIILPLLTFVITVATHFMILLLSSAALLLGGAKIAAAQVWVHTSLPQLWLVLFYHLVGLHGLWFAPIYGWLLLVSAWAKRAAFLWATLPLLAIGAVEKIAFNTTHFGFLLGHYIMSAPEAATFPPTEASMHSMAHLGVGQFLVSPGLWIGLAITVLFLTAAIRLRRNRGPL